MTSVSKEHGLALRPFYTSTSSEVAAVVDSLLKQVHQSGFEVSIVTYEQPALVPA